MILPPIVGTLLTTTPLLYLFLSSNTPMTSHQTSNRTPPETAPGVPMPFASSSSSSSSCSSLFDIQSSWSKAGIGTCFVLEQKLPPGDGHSSKKKKGMKLVLDLGCTPIIHETFLSDTVILSHAHMDHFAGIFGHARAHAMMCSPSSIPTYYVPSDLVEKLETARRCFSDIDATCIDAPSDDALEGPRSNKHRRDKSLLNMKIVPVKAGEEIEIQSPKVPKGVRLLLRPFEVCHGGHPALGYSIVSQTTKRTLKEEFQQVHPREFSKLAREGKILHDTEVVEQVEVMYSGDTNVDGLLGKGVTTNEKSELFLQQAFTAPLIISEVTYLEKKDQELARNRGHMNVFDIQPILESHGWGFQTQGGKHSTFGPQDGTPLEQRKIVFYHLSGRHGTAERIIRGLKQALPRDLLNISEVTLSSFLPDPQDTNIPISKNGCVSLKGYHNTSNKRQHPQKRFHQRRKPHHNGKR